MKLFRTLAIIIAASIGAAGLQQIAPAARAAMWNWSTTAASNATADPSINWSEGMSPSSVNDSARAMMAVLASWRNDVSAITSTTGSSTVYALTSNQGGFVANAAHDGFMIGFVPNVTNGAGGVTINVDGVGAKPLRAVTATAISAGALVAGSKYQASYKFSTDEFLLLNSFASQFEVPLGAVLPFTGDTPPNANYVITDGRCISRTTYAAYFAMVGTRFSSCDGTTTFGVIDLRGRFPGGNDEMGAFGAANRITITGCLTNFFNIVGFTCGGQTQTLTTAQLASHNHSATDSGHTHSASDSGHVHTSSNNGSVFFVTGTGSVRNDLSQATVAVGNVNATSQSTGSGSAVITVGTGNASISVGSTGGGSAHEIMNPSIVVNYIVRVL